jgi:FkbM family methyltransferase
MVSCFLSGYHRPLKPLPQDATILDVGANVGYTMIDFKRYYPRARVIGVEMDQGNFALAQRNIEGLPHVELVHGAIWFEDGEVAYDPTVDADAFSASRVGNKTVTVRAWTVNTLMHNAGLGYVHYLKLDIEGAEKDLFQRGDLGWLYKIGQISVELHGGLDPKEVTSVLQTHGMHAQESSLHWSTVVGWR